MKSLFFSYIFQNNGYILSISISSRSSQTKGSLLSLLEDLHISSELKYQELKWVSWG